MKHTRQWESFRSKSWFWKTHHKYRPTWVFFDRKRKRKAGGDVDTWSAGKRLWPKRNSEQRVFSDSMSSYLSYPIIWCLDMHKLAPNCILCALRHLQQKIHSCYAVICLFPIRMVALNNPTCNGNGMILLCNMNGSWMHVITNHYSHNFILMTCSWIHENRRNKQYQAY